MTTPISPTKTNTNFDDIRDGGDLSLINHEMRKNVYHPGVPGLLSISAAQVRLDNDKYMPVVDLYLDVEPGWRIKAVRATGVQFSDQAQIRVEMEERKGATGGRTPRSVRVPQLQFREGRQILPVTDDRAASIVTLSFNAGYRLHG